MGFLVTKEIGDEVKVSFSDTSDLAEFIALGDARNYHLVILILNNLLCGDRNDGGSRIDQAIKAIEQIKSRWNSRVIALSGFSDGPEFPGRVLSSGADYFLTLPFQHTEFRAALRGCLTRIG